MKMSKNSSCFINNINRNHDLNLENFGNLMKITNQMLFELKLNLCLIKLNIVIILYVLDISVKKIYLIYLF